MGNNTGPLGNPIRKTFSNYFSARWQNFQNLVTNTTFFTQMPREWITYQLTYVRQWDQWARGFVIDLHRGDFFSTGLGKSVVDIMTRECVKGGFRFDGKDRDVNQFCKAWADRNDFENLVAKGFFEANRLGNAIIKLNVRSGKGEVWCSVVGVDRAYFEVNNAGDVVRMRCYEYISTSTMPEGKNYYAVEDRAVKGGKPYYKITVKEQTGTVNAPIWNNVQTFDNLKGDLAERFEELYGDIKPNTWYELPFKTLACWNWKGTDCSSAVSDIRGLGESCLATALDILYAIDYNYSQAQLDQYWGRTRVGIPRELQPQNTTILHNPRTMQEVVATIEEAPLKDDVFLQFPNNGLLTDKPIQPMFIQPQLRGSERANIRDADLELLGIKVGLSTSTLSNHLRYNAGKTATEIESENDTTDITVNNKRRLANTPINRLIRELLDFYDVEAEVTIIWNTSGRLIGKSREQLTAEYQSGLIPLDETIKRLHPELTENEVNMWVEKLQQNQQQQIGSFDNSGGLF